jgi:hypothetical protein
MAIGLTTSAWGPGAWLFLHSITLAYPENPTEQDKERIKAFFLTLGEVLPCRYCRENFIRHIRKLPIQCDSRTDLVLWLIDIHNQVNEMLKKPILTREEALQKILCVYRKEVQNPCYVYYLFLFIALLLLFLCWTHHRKGKIVM